MEKLERRYESVRDYTALFRKRERKDGDLGPEDTILLKFQKPFKVYMRWLSGSRQGRELLYVQGANDNRVFVFEPAHLLARYFTVLLDPGGWRILQESRYPVTEIGIGRLLERVAREARRARGKRELHVEERRVRIQGGEVLQVEGILPQDPKAGYSYHRVVITLDETNGLSVKISVYDWDNLLIGDYNYENVRLNPGLTEMDFDPSNPAYNFPRWRISLVGDQ
ncbi:MAG: DUF1571 domain-containing protein [Deltaproteobacteria bacterium]|nr:DUF1571 domain-containing protein [Deltaproteobacteria bacterium]